MSDRATASNDEVGPLPPARNTSALDVHAQRHPEPPPREREARFRTLAESSPTGVFQTALDGSAVYANQRLLQWFDMDFEAFANGDWMSRVHPDDLPTLHQLSAETQQQLTPFDMAYRIVVNGRTRWLRVRTEPFFDHDGCTVLGHIGSVVDSTAERFAAEERAKLQTQLQQARRMESLGMLAGGIAHDFNNLLVGILANASMAREEAGLSPGGREALDDITQAAQRAAELTRQLLSYAGRARVQRSHVSLPSIVVELPKVLGARVPSHVKLEVHAVDSLTVDGDETQLRQVVLNLVTNAVDAIGQRPGVVEIAVSTMEFGAAALQQCLLGRERTPGRYAVIAVRDTGAGMSSEVQERMFDPFFSTKSGGRGLGLAATLGILNGHGGAIEVQSSEGVGTTVRVLLPLTKEHRAGTDERAAPSGAHVGGGIILLVDDDTSARTAARRILSKAGYDVREADNGAAAIACYAALAQRPRCIVLDLSMPIMSGDECLRLLRANGSTVPVLMSSGYDADDVAADLMVPGAVHFLQKPYAANALLSAVEELIVGR